MQRLHLNVLCNKSSMICHGKLLSSISTVLLCPEKDSKTNSTTCEKSSHAWRRQTSNSVTGSVNYFNGPQSSYATPSLATSSLVRIAIVTVRDWSIPKTSTYVQSFISLCTYYRLFVNWFFSIAASLHAVESIKTTISWGSTQEDAFKKTQRVTH